MSIQAESLRLVLEHAPAVQPITLQADSLGELGGVMLSHPTARLIEIDQISVADLEERILAASREGGRSVVIYEGEPNMCESVHRVIFEAIVDRTVRDERISSDTRFVLLHPRLSEMYDPAFLHKTIEIKEEA